MENRIDELYKEYGELAIQLEMVQGRLMAVKKEIALILSKEKVEKNDKN